MSNTSKKVLVMIPPVISRGRLADFGPKQARGGKPVSNRFGLGELFVATDLPAPVGDAVNAEFIPDGFGLVHLRLLLAEGEDGELLGREPEREIAAPDSTR
jgi:hypothetical protein